MLKKESSTFMKTQLSIQEKLWELRKDKKLGQKEVAQAIGISAGTISNYENDEYKDISLSVLIKFAKFYGVSLDWLVGLTENRYITNIEIAELHLDDNTIELLKSERFNNRLLCEIIKHPQFPKLMADTEIYVDGIATLQIKNLNDWLDSVRMQIIQQSAPDSDELYLKILEASHIQEDEYFFNTIHNDWDNIIRTIRKDHQFALESAPIEPTTSNYRKFKRFVQRLTLKSNPIEEFWHFFCEELQINYEKLSVEEHRTMKNILKKSKVLKRIPNHKNKARK